MKNVWKNKRNEINYLATNNSPFLVKYIRITVFVPVETLVENGKSFVFYKVIIYRLAIILNVYEKFSSSFLCGGDTSSNFFAEKIFKDLGFFFVFWG